MQDIGARFLAHVDVAPLSAESEWILFLLAFLISIGFLAGLMAFFGDSFNLDRSTHKLVSSPVVWSMKSVRKAPIVPYHDCPSDLENQVSYQVSPIVPLPPPFVSLPLYSISANGDDVEDDRPTHFPASVTDSENTPAPQVGGSWSGM